MWTKRITALFGVALIGLLAATAVSAGSKANTRKGKAYFKKNCRVCHDGNTADAPLLEPAPGRLPAFPGGLPPGPPQLGIPADLLPREEPEGAVGRAGDGETVVASGFNHEYKPLSKDHPSGMGLGDTDTGLLVTGPVAQHSRRIYDQLWTGAIQRHCPDLNASEAVLRLT